ncbi:MAG TPA: DUF4352 domain-containing protein [Candidatus Nanoarchaeia archaeon]|nr:hypothetical protein [uncultured archaeon]
MPEETPTDEVVNLNPKPKIIEIKKQTLYLTLGIGSLLIITALIGAYFLGKGSGQTADSQLEKKAKVATKPAEPAGIIKGEINEEIETLSGISITLEKAEIDGVYEKQKGEQRDYYEKNASQSAYLQDEYFNQSLLNVKIALKNKKDTAVTYSPASFRLKDSDDNQYTAGYEAEKPVLYSLNSGETTRITVAYIVPTKEKEFKLIYENAEVSFELP